MVKFVQILFVGLFAAVLCSAEAQRSRSSRLQVKRNRFLARQEAAEPAAVTPYPTADELKPEVPFNEAAEAEEQQPNQPDEVYGPPSEVADVDVVAEEEEAVDEEELINDADEEEAANARFTARRTLSAHRRSAFPAKLRKATPARLQLQPNYVPQQVFYYVAH